MTGPGWAPEIFTWLHLAATLYLCGLIWCIQVVHYPLMSAVAPGKPRRAVRVVKGSRQRR